jgi:hypothetical protein
MEQSMIMDLAPKEDQISHLQGKRLFIFPDPDNNQPPYSVTPFVTVDMDPFLNSADMYLEVIMIADPAKKTRLLLGGLFPGPALFSTGNCPFSLADNCIPLSGAGMALLNKWKHRLACFKESRENGIRGSRNVLSRLLGRYWICCCVAHAFLQNHCIDKLPNSVIHAAENETGEFGKQVTGSTIKKPPADFSLNKPTGEEPKGEADSFVINYSAMRKIIKRVLLVSERISEPASSSAAEQLKINPPPSP